MLTKCLGCMEEYDDSFDMCPVCGYEPDAVVESPIHMQPGVILRGRYLIGRVLGYGGFGVTYIAWDFTLQQKVAIKEYLPSEFATRIIGQTHVTVFGGKKEEQFGDGMTQFVEEAKRLAQFQGQEGIVRIFDCFSENNTAYIVMEHLDGMTLTAYLEQQGQIPVDDAIAMLQPVLQSLEAVHQAGIIHRDIAPDNIFLTKDGRVKLIDFGAARYATTSHSRSLTVIIKPGYSPEEQYRSRGDQGPHTDVYAIGAVLYKMITGLVLPDSMERRACFEKNGKDIVSPPSKYCKLSKSQENAIMNALNVRVEDRTPTAARFLEELTAKRSVKRIFGRIKILDLMRWPLWAKILIPTVGAAILALLILLLSGFIGPKGGFDADITLGENEARVPNVISCSADMAQSMLMSQGLNSTIVGAEYSDTIPGNTVLYQNLSAGQVVEKGTVVELFISVDMGIHADEIEPQPEETEVATEPEKESGKTDQKTEKPTEPDKEEPEKEVKVMPYVVYKSESEAKSILTALGLKVTTKQVYDEAIAAGLVTGQSISAGTDVTDGGTVTLEISKGKDPNKEEATETNVTLNKSEYSLYVGDTVTLVPAGGNGSYRYSSSNTSVVKVSRNGTVEAVGAGTARITVSSGKAKEAICTVTIKDYTMSLSPKSVSLFVDGTASLSVSGIPGNAQVTWKSGDSGVATVSSGGTVTGVGAGSTTITATWKNGKRTYSAAATVSVESMGLTLSTYKIGSFYVGESRTITASTSPANQQVSWKSSNTKVATVSGGTITAVGGGKATITASFGKFSESCEVTVTQPAIGLSAESVSLYVGDTSNVSATVTPNGTSVTWSSADTGVAKVSGGTITAVGSGSTKISAKMTYAGVTYTASCKVNVKKPGISISKESASLLPGESLNLTATTTPGDCTVKWSSSNSSVATVSGGSVKAVAAGSAKITAQITYGGNSYKASCTVTVAEPTIVISSDSSVITYSEIDNGTCTISAQVNPDGGKISWKSDNSKVAIVSGNDKNATVTAISEGKAKITATYTLKGRTVTDTCTISVEKAPSTLTVANASYPSVSTVENFMVSGKITSNYAITRVECTGTAKINALGLSVPITSTPYEFNPGTYTADLSELTPYFINQYRDAYETLKGLAGAVGLDQSVTVDVYGTCYDTYGNSGTFRLTYTLTN